MADMDAIKQTFFEECDEQLVELEQGLLEIDEGGGDRETVNAVFRAVHSIKGGAGAFQLNDLVHFAHTFETTLDLVREDKLEPGPEVMRTMLRASDILADLVGAARDGRTVPADVWEPAVAELAAYCGGNDQDLSSNESGGEEVNVDDDEAIGFQPIELSLDDLMGGVDDDGPDGESPNEYTVRFKPNEELYTSANDPCLLLRELTRLGEAEVTCDTSAVPGLDDFDPDGTYFEWTVCLTTTNDEDAVREIFEFVEDCCELEISQSNSPVELPLPADESDVEAFEAVDLNDANEFSFAESPIVEDAVAAEFEVVPLDIDSIGQDGTAADEAPEVENLTAAQEPAEPVEAPTEASPTEPAKAAEPDASPAADKPVRNQTIRADLKRVDRLINLVGELVINQAMLSQSVAREGLESATDVTTGLDELEQLTRQIQDSVMAIRAQPVKPMFQRMSRVVREAAEATGKIARLKLEGDSTEVDKTVIEKLADPLTHMIRNAVDHGLESTQKRIDAGKSEEGTVRLSAAHRSGRVVIEVSDDGAGINRDRVRAMAVEKGIVAEDSQLSDSEIDNLIFAPGFSTASEVSDLSGRGVGMDVVRRSIQAVGGRVTISSNPGSGSTFTMSLPLTLAVLDGMIISVAEQTLVVPITAIVETLKPNSDDIHQMGSDNQLISVRNKFVPLIDIGLQLGFREEAAKPEQGVVVLIETDDGDSSAILVDSIQDQSQVVIKSLENNYGHVDGIAAATILGDGRVALIADVDGLVEHARSDPQRSEPVFAQAG